MKKTTVFLFCDRCGKEIKSEYWKIRPHRYTMNDTEELSELFLDHMDREYCTECAAEIMGYAAVTFPARKKTPKKKEEPPADAKEPKKRTEAHERLTKNKTKDQPVDKGKIFALRNAGWSWKDIRTDIRMDIPDDELGKLYEEEKTRRENMDPDKRDTEDSALYWGAMEEY